jgi:general secretion pathway protein N
MGNPLWGVPLGSLSATRERPLFSPSRRPPAVAVAAPPPPPQAHAPDQPQLGLVGTVIGSTGSIGVFTDQATKAIVRLRIGEGHDGWILHAIDARAATFERDRREVTLVLPGRAGMEQQGTVIPALVAPPAGIKAKAPPVPPPRPRVGPPVRPPWMDQGGSPQRAESRTALQNPSAAAWLDGDGQMVSPPPRER